MNLRLLKNLSKNELSNKRILLRADFDVSISSGKIKEDYRIKKVIPTISFLLEHGGKIRLISHLGRPHGKPDPKLTLRPVAEYLEKSLNKKILFIDNPLDPESATAYQDSSDIILFENLRFWPGEESNDPIFAQKLKIWGDIYINEAFANSHRDYVSMTSLPRLLPSFAGLWLEQEIESLEKIVENPAKPVMAILGGAKIETKLPLIEKFLNNNASVLVAGKLANTILMAKGVKMNDLCGEKESLEYLKNLDLNNPNLYFPMDGLVAVDLQSKERWTSLEKTSPLNTLRPDECVFDIGPATVKAFADILSSAKTIFWNGPVGVCEDERFAKGTEGLIKSLAEINAFKVSGGGDSIAAINQKGLLGVFNHVSTGGGSMLEFLAGKKLPGIEVLRK